MEKNLVLFIGPLEGPIIEAKQTLVNDNEYEILEIAASDLKLQVTPKNFPCAVLASSYKTSMIFMQAYREVLAKTSSKFILAYPEKLEEKTEKQLYGLGATDVIYGANLNPKTIAHKAKLAIKTIPKQDEEALKALRVERLITEQSSEILKKVRSQIDYEVVDYLAVTKMCDKSVRHLNDIETAMEQFEQSGSKSLIKDCPTHFDEIIDTCRKNNFELLANFSEIPKNLSELINSQQDAALVDIMAGILLNTLDLLRFEFTGLKEKKITVLLGQNPHLKVVERFRWLADKLNKGAISHSIDRLLEKVFPT